MSQDIFVVIEPAIAVLLIAAYLHWRLVRPAPFDGTHDADDHTRRDL